MTPRRGLNFAALTIDPMKSWTAILHNRIRRVRRGIPAGGQLKISLSFGQEIVSNRWFAVV
jgi:hypothetical protein